MKKHDMRVWFVLVAIPVVSLFATIALWFVVYRNLKVLKPDTKRSIGKDLLLCLVTLGLFALVLPYRLMKELQEGAKRLGVQVPNLIGLYYGVMLLALFPQVWRPETGGQLVVYFAFAAALNIVGVYCFLKPFNVVADAYAQLAPQDL